VNLRLESAKLPRIAVSPPGGLEPR